MVSILVGIAFVVGGLWGVLHWMPQFLTVLKGLGPLAILSGGIIALFMGFASFRRNQPNEKKK